MDHFLLFPIQISGPDPPKPVSSFAHLGFDEQLMKAIRRSEYTQPTPVQAAGVPAALSGRDLIGKIAVVNVTTFLILMSSLCQWNRS